MKSLLAGSCLLAIGLSVLPVDGAEQAADKKIRVLKNPAYAEVLARGLRWAAGK